MAEAWSGIVPPWRPAPPFGVDVDPAVQAASRLGFAYAELIADADRAIGQRDEARAEVERLREQVAERDERLRLIGLACEGVRSAARGARTTPVETGAIRTWLGAQGHQVDPLPDEAPPVLTADRALDMAADMFERIARGDS